MGLFDLPAPLFVWVDAKLAAVLPPTARLVLWGVLGALVSMGLYRFLSPQGRIAQGKRDLAQAKQRLDAYDGEMDGAWPLIRGMLGTAFAQVGRVGGPAILASLPLLALLTWISTAYGYGYPEPGGRPEVQVTPPGLQAEWVERNPGEAAAAGVPHVRLSEEGRGVVADVPLAAPVPVVHKRQWWNTLLGNPAGYLPADALVERVRIALPKREYLPVGPAWARGWELTFFAALIVMSLGLKWVARIE